jgi:methylmalonyl-CoA mutase
MPEPSIHDLLRKTFPASGKANWLRTASQELPEKKSIENLAWNVDGLKFYPYYDKEDLKNLAYLKGYHNHLPDTLYHHPGHWGNLPKITVTEEKNANERALQYLATGADGIIFDITTCFDCNIDQLLESIDWPSCSVSFLTSSDQKFPASLLAYADQKKYDHTQLTGSIYWKSLSEIAGLKEPIALTLKRYHHFGILIPRGSPIHEISTSLEQAVHVMETMTNLRMEKNSVFRSISVSFYSEENFFITIAKMKALRLLWYQLSQAYGITSFFPEELHINVISAKWTDEKFDPHGNMIKNTTQALASVLGGCNSLTIDPEEEDNKTMSRIARNISIILKEESHVDKVADPIAGTYALECMVDALSQAAWSEFQKNVSA